MYPFIWILNGAARLLVGLFGIQPASEQEKAHSEEELRLLLSESFKSGEINKNELNYVNKIFEFDETTAKEIMVPRTEMVTISIDNTFDEILKTIRHESFTRYPVVDGDKDHIVGIIHAKEFLTALAEEEPFNLMDHINPVIRVIDTIPLHDLLVRLRKERTHMAILMDEYGGTSGLVTIEDIVEEIVGEIQDEFDEDEIPEIRKIDETHYILDAKLRIEDVNALLNIHISDDEMDTIGGWFFSQNIEFTKGSEIEVEGYLFKIYESEGHKINYIEVKKIR